MTVPVDRRALRRPRRGDYVTTTSGVYGLVVAQAWAAEQLTVFEERVGGDAVEHCVFWHDCRAERSMDGSYEVCQAFVSGQPCRNWAARVVEVVAVDGCGLEVCDADGYALAGLMPERWASCWYHLPAAIDLASRWFDEGVCSEVRLGQVQGGSSERPAWLADVDFCEPLYVASPVVEVAS